jgi:hypothetical protein
VLYERRRLLLSNEMAKQGRSVKQTFYLIKEKGSLIMEKSKTVAKLSDNKRIMAVLFVVDRTFI